MDWFLFCNGTGGEKVTALILLPFLLCLYVLVATLHLFERAAYELGNILKEVYLSTRSKIFSDDTILVAKRKYLKPYGLYSRQ